MCFNSQMAHTSHSNIPGVIAALEASDQGTYRFIASTETPDSMRRVLRVAGWDLEAFNQNPVMLWDHGHSAALEREPIGSVPSINASTFQGKPALVAEVQPGSVLAPVAQRLWEQVDAGTLKAVSIGANATEAPVEHFKASGEIDYLEYTGQTLNELSLVAVGANPDALRIAASAFGADFPNVFSQTAVAFAAATPSLPPSGPSLKASASRRVRIMNGA